MGSARTPGLMEIRQRIMSAIEQTLLGNGYIAVAHSAVLYSEVTHDDVVVYECLEPSVMQLKTGHMNKSLMTVTFNGRNSGEVLITRDAGRTLRSLADPQLLEHILNEVQEATADRNWRRGLVKTSSSPITGEYLSRPDEGVSRTLG